MTFACQHLCLPPAMQRRVVRTTALLTLATALSGCANIKLHSENRQKQGEAAAKAWSEVNLKPTFDTERSNQVKILEAQIAAAAKRNAFERELAIHQLAELPIDVIPKYYEEAIKMIALSSAPEEPQDSSSGSATTKPPTAEPASNPSSRDTITTGLATPSLAPVISRSETGSIQTTTGSVSAGTISQKSVDQNARRPLIRKIPTLPGIGTIIFTRDVKSGEFIPLTGINQKDYDDFNALRANISSATRQRVAATADLTRYLSLLQSNGAPLFKCDQLTSADQKDVKAWRETYHGITATNAIDTWVAAATNECRSIERHEKSISESIERLPPSRLKLTYGAWQKANADLEKKEIDAAHAQDKYSRALKSYNDVQKGIKDNKSTAETAKQRAEDVAKLLGALEGVSGFLGKKLASEERIKRINDLLDSLKKGEPLSTDTASNAEIAIAIFPRIADNLRALRKAGKGQSEYPLLLQRDIEMALGNAANTEVARERQNVGLLNAVLDASIKQLETMNQARNNANEALGDSKTKEAISALTAENKHPPNIHEAWGRLTPETRAKLLESTSKYLEAAYRQERSLDEMKIMLLTLPIDREVDRAEANASIWASLIGPSVGQAAEFSSLGIKTEDITNIFELLGIFYIGHGVNE